MKDNEVKIKEIEDSHTRWNGGRSCPRERVVERVYMIRWYQTM
jgi:hypothetical protein